MNSEVHIVHLGIDVHGHKSMHKRDNSDLFQVLYQESKASDFWSISSYKYRNYKFIRDPFVGHEFKEGGKMYLTFASWPEYSSKKLLEK